MIDISAYVGLCKKLTWYALKLTRHREDAEDLMQDTVLKAWRLRYTCHTAEVPWMRSIMLGVFKDRFRYPSNFKHRTYFMSETEFLEPEYPSQADDNIRLHEVSAAIDLLSPVLSECFCLQAYGLDYAEIALQLGIPIGTVKSRISRARAQLAEAMG